MKTYKRLLLQLLQVDRVGPVFVYRALSVLSGIADQTQVIAHFLKDHDALTAALEAIVVADEHFLVSRGICSQAAARAFTESLKDVNVEQDIADVVAAGANVDTCFDVEYPELLRHIHAPPVILYRMGKVIDNNRPALAVVGSRKATAYGISCVQELIPSLARAGVNLVSGGAVGIDAAVHQKTLDNDGVTTVVLGSGLLQMYPYAHKNLFASIVANGGTIITPFAMRQRPERGSFPARNRIIAGLAGACLVIEASAKSGALITASYALDANRTVCAVPGPIFSETSQGCHDLLRRGAVLITSALDLAKELGCGVDGVEKPERLTARGDVSQEEEFFVFLSKTPRSEEEIAVFLGKSISETQAFLFDLQLEGKILQQFTGLWGLFA